MPRPPHSAQLRSIAVHLSRPRYLSMFNSQSQGAKRASTAYSALRPLHSSAQSERLPRPLYQSSHISPPSCCPCLSTCEREPSESCSFNFHEIIICFVIRASLAGRQQQLRGVAHEGIATAAARREEQLKQQEMLQQQLPWPRQRVHCKYFN